MGKGQVLASSLLSCPDQWRMAVVGSDELVALEGGCDNDAVSGVGVEIGKLSGADTDEASERHFHHSLLQLGQPPRGNIFSKVDASLLFEHCHFPEGNGGNGNLPRSRFTVNGLP